MLDYILELICSCFVSSTLYISQWLPNLPFNNLYIYVRSYVAIVCSSTQHHILIIHSWFLIYAKKAKHLPYRMFHWFMIELSHLYIYIYIQMGCVASLILAEEISAFVANSNYLFTRLIPVISRSTYVIMMAADFLVLIRHQTISNHHPDFINNIGPCEIYGPIHIAFEGG